MQIPTHWEKSGKVLFFINGLLYFSLGLFLYYAQVYYQDRLYSTNNSSNQRVIYEEEQQQQQHLTNDLESQLQPQPQQDL